MTLHIRLATINDRAAIEAIVNAAYAPYVPRIGRSPAPMTDDYGARIGARQAYVMESGGAVRGLVVLIPEPDCLLLDNIAIDPAAQGMGLGRALLAFAEAMARKKNYAAIRLYTNAAMTENIALYARIGYAETRRDGEDGFQRVYMRKALPG